MPFIKYLIIVALSTISVHSSETNGTCFRTWLHTTTERELYHRTYLEHYWDYCGWQRCPRVRLRTQTEHRTKPVTHLRKLEFCCPGYKRISLEPLKCDPTCFPECILSSCTSPGICDCYPGYRKTELPYECEPHCDSPCINGKCIGNNTCVCTEGYKRTENHICEPECTNGCINGNCIAPNKCECYNGYRLSENNTYECWPHCENCINGECIAPHYCECYEGFDKLNGTCLPHCSRECIQGKCTSPEKCTCNLGYIAKPGEWNECIPYCSEPCINSICTEPENCTCYENYLKNNNTFCEPICNETCINGECIEPNLCQCNDGYSPLTNYTCQPECTNECVNGNCTEPEFCSCFDGYRKSDLDEFVCEAICEDGCLSGTCTLPNVCTCEQDYIKVKHNVCLPICRDDCEDNFENCTLKPECIQIGKHFFPKGLHYTSHNAVIDLNAAMMTLNWSCNHLFNNYKSDCNINKCDSCSTLPLDCIAEINLNDKHIDFICKISVQNDTYDRNDTNYYKDNIGEEYNYSLFFIHPEELQAAPRGQCNVCMCASNLKRLHKNNEAMFYFIPCNQEKAALTAGESFGYLYALVGVLVLLSIILITIIIYKLRTASSTYGLSNSKYDEQELTVEEQSLVEDQNNIHEDD